MRDALARALEERPEGEEALETMRTFMLASHRIEKSELDVELGRCIENDETLRSHLRARLGQFEELIAAAIAKDIGASKNDLRPYVVAASLIAAFMVMSERGDSSAKPQTPAEVAAAIDPVFAFVRGGLDALRATSSGPSAAAVSR
jgi:hypothetical protein